MVWVRFQLAPKFHDNAVEASVVRLPLAIEDTAAKVLARLRIAFMRDELDQQIALGRSERNQRPVRCREPAAMRIELPAGSGFVPIVRTGSMLA